MFEIGEYVVCGAKGVCQIRDITHIDMSGADKEKLYYVLAPVGDKNGTIYVPTDSEKIIMRRTISKEEAERLIDELPQIELLWVPDDKQREETYKEALRTCDYHAWVSIVKTLYQRKKERLAQGKKATAVDERYMKAAENGLYGELSLTLGVPRERWKLYQRETFVRKGFDRIVSVQTDGSSEKRWAAGRNLILGSILEAVHLFRRDCYVTVRSSCSRR